MSEAKTVVLIRGDGIGPEITDAVLKVLDCLKLNLRFIEAEIGLKAVERFNDPLPEDTLNLLREYKVGLKGPTTTAIGTGFKSVNVGLRKALDLYANVRPAVSMTGVKSRYENVNLVTIRENTEGLYSGIEHEVVPGVVESLKIVTRKASTRIAEFAFNYAREQGHKKITFVHKANIMKLSDGLSLECYREVAKNFPEIPVEEKIVDAMAMELVLHPEKFDLLLMENLYGDILSDLCAGLVGGLGLAPSGNIGVNGAVFEAVHGSAPDLAGKGSANPTALLLSAAMMLDYLGLHREAQQIDAAIKKTIAQGKFVTADLGGKSSTLEYTSAVIDHLGV
ncbi:isocitrate/isopropylmalate dehydrogenase family protein [bacterium]|nr:isocitrate/isopropylmalate dehydrogenase family protein [bacterium]